MTKYGSFVLLTFAAIHFQLYGQSPHVRFGLESSEFYSEGKETLQARVRTPRSASTSQSSGMKPRPGLEGDFRWFAFNSRMANDQGLQTCFDHHWKLWDRFKSERKDTLNRDEFLKLKSEEDPFCDGLARRFAPVLFFDFEATQSGDHILETIEIQTLGFDEYKGGGFFKQEAWYDISLSPKLGTKQHTLDKRFTFSGSGDLKLRLWSENFYPSMGWISPMGRYALRLKFTFSVNGRSVACTTDAFLVDV